MRKELTTKEVVERFKKVHGDSYDYFLVEYVGDKTKISIRCRKDGHGVFEQTPNNHYRGSGCPKCGDIKTSTTQLKPIDDFIKQAKEVHSGKNYGYGKVDYKGNKEKVIIVCPVHGDFPQRPSDHLRGKGCPDCGRITLIEKQRLTIEEFIEKSNLIHNNLYVVDPY